MKLLFNYLPYSMKDSDSVVRSTKKANTKAPTNGSSSNTKITKFFSSFYSSNNSNTTAATTTANLNKDGTIKKRVAKTNSGIEKPIQKRVRKKAIEGTSIATQKSPTPMTNGTKRKKSISSSQVSTASSSSSTSSNTITNGKSSTSSTPTKKVENTIRKTKKGNNKSSPKLRPRRRASQTYFFKYQLARNPLKAEEEDLKLALLASLQQDDGDLSKQHMQQLKRQQLITEHHLQNNNNNGEINNNNSATTTTSTTTATNNSTTITTNNNCSNNNNKQPKKGVQSNNHQQSNKQHKQKHPPQYQTVIQDVRPPAYDEEYLKRFRPETEDFLTFICFRLNGSAKYATPTQQKLQTNELSTILPTASMTIDQLSNSINYRPVNGCSSTTTGINIKICNDKTSNEYHNLRRSASPCKSSASNQTASNSSPNHLNSPSNRRRPTRHSPRLASSSRKISEFDSLNHYTAYDNLITYEEEMKRASMALEDMAQEINGSDDSETGQSPTDSMPFNNSVSSVTKSTSPYKNNKHLVKGLMTREFAGAFADEEIIFESIKNHKL